MNPRTPLILLAFLAGVAALAGCAGEPIFPTDWSDGTPRTLLVVPSTKTRPPALFTRGKRTTGGVSEKDANDMAKACLTVPILGQLLACPTLIFAAFANPFDAETTEILVSHSLTASTESEKIRRILTTNNPELLLAQKIAASIQARAAHDVRLKAYKVEFEDLASEEGVDALLEIQLKRFGLVIDSSFELNDENPVVKVFFGVKTIFYPPEGERFRIVALREEFGGAHWLSDLLAADGRLLKEEIETVTSALAENIVR